MHEFMGGAQIEHGSIGWEGEDEYVFAGSEDNDGLTLVRVQLFNGRDYTKPLSGRAQGTKIVCLLSDGVFRVPPKDARCIVAIPQGLENTPGGGVIIATISGGNEVRRNISSGDTVIAPTGDEPGQAMIITKQDGSVTIHTTDSNESNGRSVFFRVSTKAFQFVAPWGRLIFDASGFHLKTTSGKCRLDMGGINIPLIPDNIAALFGGYITLVAPTIRAKGSSVFLGTGVLYNPVLVTPVVPSNPPPHVTPPFAIGDVPAFLQSGSVWSAP